MAKWEHRLVEIPYGPHEDPAELKGLGDQGWEAVGMSLRAATDKDNVVRNPFVLTVLMKRERPGVGGTFGR